MIDKKGLARGVIGIDEVGRGPLAGPVTVAAVYLRDPKNAKTTFFPKTIRDSKKLTYALRINIFSTIRKNRTSIIYAICSKSAKYIDKHGIVAATQACALSCLDQLEKKGVDVKKTQVNLDAGLSIIREDLKQGSFVKGDETFVEIALASIVAKVNRDAYMERIHEQFPLYNFYRNVGYGTKAHREAIKMHGVTKYHRCSFLTRILTI